MSKNDKYLYLVEGENEKTFINAIKNDYIVSGKVSVFNVLTKTITTARLRKITPMTNVVLVFDTDVNDKSCIQFLQKNIDELKKSKNVKSIILVIQVNNFEDELLRATSISKLIDFTNSKSVKDFKGDFNKLDKSLIKKLQQFHFDIDKLWIKQPQNLYKNLSNMSIQVKIKRN